MNVIPCNISGLLILEPKVFGDARGFFLETWNQRRYLEAVAQDTRAAIKAGIGIAEAYRHVANSERGKWLLFDEYHARNVTASYKELEWE